MFHDSNSHSRDPGFTPLAADQLCRLRFFVVLNCLLTKCINTKELVILCPLHVSVTFATAGGEKKQKVVETRFTFNDMKK
jgi:hypothetical protein